MGAGAQCPRGPGAHNVDSNGKVGRALPRYMAGGHDLAIVLKVAECALAKTTKIEKLSFINAESNAEERLAAMEPRWRTHRGRCQSRGRSL